jgi:hypothetical protein
MHHAVGGRVRARQRCAHGGARSRSADDRRERAVERTQRRVDQLVLRGGDGDDRGVEALEQRPHAGKRTACRGHAPDGLGAGRRPPEAPLRGQRIDGRSQPAVL